jgi:hypothetical protein
MKRTKDKTKKGGYAILFTVVIVGIISMITIGLSNAAYKQMILSSVAKDSTTAFYQADIASECALYMDNESNNPAVPPTSGSASWTCAGNSLTYTASGSSPITLVNLEPATENSSNKCFRALVTKTESPTSISTEVQAKGYNICEKANSRTVERAIKVNY